MNYTKLAKAQEQDPKLDALLNSSDTIPQLAKFQFSLAKAHIYCDLTTQNTRPFHRTPFQRSEFDSVLNLAHAEVKATA